MRLTDTRCIGLSASDGLVRLDQEVLPLTPKASAILSHLLAHAGSLVPTDELLDAIWPETHIQPEAIKVYIHEIRRALGDDPRNPRYIETISRRGYRLIAPIYPSATAASVTLPLRVKRAPLAHSLFGRNCELSELEKSFQAAVHGDRQLILISGEAGIGKTSLVNAFVDSLPANPECRVMMGRCIRIGGLQEPYYPVLEALGQLDVEDLPAKLAAQAPTWAVQFPGMFSPSDRERIVAEVWSATPLRMLREICEFLELLSRTTALVLILEDVHWADPATVDFISAAAQRIQPARLMVVCTLRDVDATSNRLPIAAVIRELRGNSRCMGLELKPLSRRSVQEVLIRTLGDTLTSPSLVDRVSKYTGGNPLFLRSVVQELMESGRNFGDEAEADYDALKPTEDLQRFLHGQLLDMPEDDRTLLEYASVAGSTFTGSALAPLLNADPATAEALCEKLAAKCTWVKFSGPESISGATSQFEFRHGLYKDVVYGQVGRARRSRIHRCLAENLVSSLGEMAVERSAELAWRYQECGDIDKSIHYLERAGGQAMRRFAPREAALMFDRARLLALRCPDPCKRVEHLRRLVPLLANAYMLSGEPGRNVPLWNELIDVAVAAGHRELAASAALACSFPNMEISCANWLDSVERAINLSASCKDPELLAQAKLQKLYLHLAIRGWDARDACEAHRLACQLQSSGSEFHTARAWVVASWIRFFQSEYDKSLNAAENTSRLAMSLNHAVLFEHAQDRVLSALCASGRWSDALTHYAAALQRHERNGNMMESARVKTIVATHLYAECFDFDRILAICESVDCSVGHSPVYAGISLLLRARAQVGVGQTVDALRVLMSLAPDALSLSNRWILLFARTEALLLEAALDDALQSAEELIQFATSTENRSWHSRAYQLAARVRLASGAVAAASEMAESALRLVGSAAMPVVCWRAFAIAADVCDRNGRRQQAGFYREQGESIVRKLIQELQADPALAGSFESGALELLKRRPSAIVPSVKDGSYVV